MDTNSTVGSFQGYPSVTSPVASNYSPYGMSAFSPPMDFQHSHVSEDMKESSTTEQDGYSIDENNAMTENSESCGSSQVDKNIFKQDPSISLYESYNEPMQQATQLPKTSSSELLNSKPIQYHSVMETTRFSKRGTPTSEMGSLNLAVTEYSIQMSPHKLTMLASKCHADECGFVLVFEVPKMRALALSYFRTGNLTVCDVVFTNVKAIVNSNPLHFTGHFICMLRRSKTVMTQKLKNIVIDDILCCRPWFDTKFIEFNTINPIISDVSIVCAGRKAICIGQTAKVNFSVNACNPSPLYFHPEAKGLHFSPQVVIIPKMSCLSLPVQITPLEGCTLRPHIRLTLCDLNENQEKIGLTMPFVVLPKIKHMRTIRGYEVIYVDDDKSCLRVIDELQMIACGFVFLDTEWKPMSSKQHNKVALIQMCAGNKCYLIHIHKFRDRIPRQLFNFLASPKIIKIGLAISYDAKKFVEDYREPIQPILDLRDFTWFQDRDKKSLNFLVQNVLREPNRAKKVTMSNWEADLDEMQIEYAALDVIFMSEIFTELFGGQSEMQAFAILMFNKRNPSLTKNVVIPSMNTHVNKSEPSQTDDIQTGTIKLVDSDGNFQYNITKKHAKRLLLLQQARKLSEHVLQLQ